MMKEEDISGLEGDNTKDKGDNIGTSSSGLPYPTFFNGNGDFLSYLRTFNRIATAHNWTPSRCTQILPLYLQGSALAIYESMPVDEKSRWKTLVEKLAGAIAQAKRVDELNRTIKDETRKRLEKIEVKAALAEVNEVRDPYQNYDQYYYEEQFQESNGCNENGDDEKMDPNVDPYYANDQYYDDEGQWFPHESNENWGEEYCQDQGYQNWPTDGTDFEEY